MKKALITIVTILLCINSYAKEFHLIIVAYDFAMDKNKITEQITQLKNINSEAEYLLYRSYGDKYDIFDNMSWNTSIINDNIYAQDVVYSYETPAERDRLSNILEQYIQFKDSIDEGGFKKNISQQGYTAIIFDCLVGNTFFQKDYHNSIIARLLHINSLNQNDFDVFINYYPCGANYTNEDIAFKAAYCITKIPEIIQ